MAPLPLPFPSALAAAGASFPSLEVFSFSSGSATAKAFRPLRETLDRFVPRPMPAVSIPAEQGVRFVIAEAAAANFFLRAPVLSKGVAEIGLPAWHPCALVCTLCFVPKVSPLATFIS